MRYKGPIESNVVHCGGTTTANIEIYSELYSTPVREGARFREIDKFN